MANRRVDKELQERPDLLVNQFVASDAPVAQRATTLPDARSRRSTWDTVASFMSVATARSVTLIGPVWAIETRSDDRFGSPSIPKRRGPGRICSPALRSRRWPRRRGSCFEHPATLTFSGYEVHRGKHARE